MRCMNCGYESADDFVFCQRCGAAAPEVAPKNTAADRVFACLKDGLFLAVCILLTCAGALIVACAGIPVIIILAAIFSWLAYSDAKKGIVNVKHLRRISGTVYANYVVTNVGGIICIVCGVIAAVLTPFITLVELPVEIEMWLGEFLGEVGFSQLFLMILLAIFAGAFIFGGVIGLVINILGMKKIHRFVKSVYVSVKSGNEEFYKPRAAKAWLIVFTCFNGVSALVSMAGNILSALASGCITAALIITVILINKYFTEKQ